MCYNKIIFFLLIFFTGLYSQPARGQSLNINGDTILVNMEAEVQIIFPTRPTSYNTIPVRTQFHIWDVKTGIYLIPVKDDYTPATLLVSEAGRNHRFVLIYKRDISVDDAKLYYDYSTVDKLAQHIRQSASIVSALPAKTATSLEPVKSDNKKNKEETAVVTPGDSSLNYYALLDQGDRELKSQNYQDATATFNKAHSLRPEDPFPLQRLEDLKIKLAEKEKNAGAQVDKKYTSLTAEAKAAYGEKKYTAALEIYKKALEVKPGDVYVTQQLQTLTNLLLKMSSQKPLVKKDPVISTNATPDEKLLKKQLSDESNYNIAIKSADSYFKAGNYDSAKALYAAALIFSKKDWPENQISRINKILDYGAAKANNSKEPPQQLNIARETQLKTDSGLPAAGNKKEPQPLPIAPEPKHKTDSVLPVAENKKQPKQLLVAPESKRKADSVGLSLANIKKSYNLAMVNAKSGYLKNDLLNAKIFYEEAISLQPLQQEPKNQLKIINSKLDEIARQNEIDSNYERTINMADSQVNAKAFESAVITYNQASVIKPLEVYPKKQLKYLQSELALNEKNKREERERQYIEALARADKAVTDKNYDEAKSAYTEVLAIHPENDYAKKRLDIISYQIEKARLEKLSEDSLKQVVIPVKKTKKKKSS